MKKRLLSVILFLAVLFFGNVNADNVNLSTAQQVGAYFFTVATGAKAPVAADKLDLVQQLDNPTLSIPALYCFNVADNGFVVVSGSYDVEPILAYSPDGRIDSKHINPAAQYFLDGYAKLVSEMQTNAPLLDSKRSSLPQFTINEEAETVSAQWDALLSGTFTCDLTKAGALVQAKWDQGEPEDAVPTYNLCCPTIDGKHCYAGCGPVAMAMIIHYWKYPVKGSNSASVNWRNQAVTYNFTKDSNKFLFDLMPAKLKNTSSYEERHAVSKLMFAAGVAAKANWGLDGTSVTDEPIPSAFTRYFKYHEEITYKNKRNQGISDAQWRRWLHEDIDSNGRPIYYTAVASAGSGRDAAGHAFVVCGSSATDVNKFYVNWGWGGSSNGFFTLTPASSITYAGGYKFSEWHTMVFKIHPSETTPVAIDEIPELAQSLVYPNPASEYVMLPAYNLPNNALLFVYGVDGKMVDKKIVPARSNEFRLDLQGYAPGTYFYRLNGNAVKFIVK